ncbi:alpha/beta hydrolase [Janthinobacterium aquaticum]|uniref:alpha/beta hydrolase n=1 Tax=Janthinobacterium sp. FT58W TaxID=2654254 RepID=UPI00186B03B0|nr:alpha/beta hydrolase [Janthinobacterium sp. FT58W]
MPDAFGGAEASFSSSAAAAGAVAGGMAKREKNALLLTVYYATDRQYRPADKKYGWQPNRAAPHLSYGSVQVSVPIERVPGTLPLRPWYDMVPSNDAGQYVLVKQIARWSRSTFLRAVKAGLAADPTSRAAFIYIHGYSNTFDEAASRTAQMAVDLDIDAIPVFYSWPSKGTLAGYAYDQNSVEWTQAHLQQFLSDFADHTGVTDIYIIAHSMGNRPMTLALASLLEQRADLLPRFRQIVLAAPDINADVFREQIAPRFANLKLPVTLYASANDKAMRASYGFADWRRIGDISPPVTAIDGLELIDASSVTMNFMGHDYFASNRALLTDIATLFKTGQRASKRGGLRGMPATAPLYWAFP